MLTLGIPGNAAMALMVGAMTIQGIAPGPSVMTDKPALFWGLIASMWIGNAMLVILNLPLVGLWVKLLTIPYTVLFPGIVAFSLIGVYSVSGKELDVYTLALFGMLGYVLTRRDFEVTPLLLGFVLGPMMETYLRRALIMSRGSVSYFWTQPISAGLLIAACVVIVLLALPSIGRRRQQVFVED
jgi:putative tricarboxylic transport membrane protein